MITIIDYGMGNLGSIRNMLRRVGADCIITAEPEKIAQAKKILLPGVGSFDQAMQRINAGGLKSVLDHKALVERVPVLGICLGMQLLTRASEEGKLPGLAWIQADTLRFPALPNVKIPHMGWNRVIPSQLHPLTDGLPDVSRFYFVHSYYVRVDAPCDSVLTAEYGIRFDAAVARGNIWGAQFHPEKSHRFGMKLFSNFAGVTC